MQSICLEEAGVSGSFAEDSTLIGLTFSGYLRSKVYLHVLFSVECFCLQVNLVCSGSMCC